MYNKYQCLCQTISPILKWSKWVGILPIDSKNAQHNHLNTGCVFHVSKFWYGVSIFLQIVMSFYVAGTTVRRLYMGSPDKGFEFEWYLMTMGYMIMEADGFIALMGGLLSVHRIAKLLQRISRLNGSAGEMRLIAYQLRKSSIIIFVFFCVLLFSFIFVAIRRIDDFETVTWDNILDAPPGVIFRGLSSIFSQTQCAVVVMMCLIIGSKFQHLADTIKLTLQYATMYSSPDESTTGRRIKTSIKWMSAASDIMTISHLEHIIDQHEETIECVSELNKCFGLQLLVTFTSNLFATVYYLYRTITAPADEDNFVSNKVHCVLSLFYLLIKLIIYMAAGQKLFKQSKKPVKEMQRGKLLYLPLQFQQKIQSLILQWLSIDPCYLTAYGVINIGPWLLAPIAGNAVTYLLVAIQFKFSMPLTNSTAIL